MLNRIEQNKSYQLINQIKFPLLISLIGVFSFFIFYSESISLILLVFICLGMVCIYIVNFNVMHPYTWFIPFFILYSISFSVLYITNSVDNTVQESIIIETLKQFWIALITFIIIITPKQNILKFNKDKLLKVNFVNKFILYTSILGIVFMCIYVLASGVNTKKDIALNDSVFITLGLYSIQFYTLSFVINLISKLVKKEKVDKLFLTSTIIMSLLVIFIVGERDFLIKIVLLSFIIFNVFVKRTSGVKLALIGVLSLFLMSLLQNFKNIFLKESKLVPTDESLLLKILGGEFVSAGRNLYILNENLTEKIFKEKSTLFTDIKFAFSNLPFVNWEVITPTSWFNNTFYASYVARGGGKGFTLVGEGFINLGIFGIVIWFILVGVFIKIFYNKAINSPFWFVAYLLLVPMTIYCLRADLGIFLSYNLKYIAIPMLFIFIIYKVNSKRNKYQRRVRK
jgi:oligosaccharide repeat unit polymerase